ncbi:MAG: hypothetical protein ACR2OI_04335 [Acidimicrobiia bacterium]
MIDGQQQREALAAAERSLFLLQKGRLEEAGKAAERARELDQVSIFDSLPGAVGEIVRHRSEGNPVPSGAWDGLAAAVGPGPLAAHVADLRG